MATGESQYPPQQHPYFIDATTPFPPEALENLNPQSETAEEQLLAATQQQAQYEQQQEQEQQQQQQQQQQRQLELQQQDIELRSPVQLPPAPAINFSADVDNATEVAEFFSDADRDDFLRLMASPEHVNAMRIDVEKQRRILYYLQNPSGPAQRGKEAKDKYEAKKKWALLEQEPTFIYRQPCNKFHQYRLLVPQSDVFDAIALEHMRWGHWGRNRLQKVIADKFYGISREEIQWVLDRCHKCGPKKGRKPLSYQSLPDSSEFEAMQRQEEDGNVQSGYEYRPAAAMESMQHELKYRPDPEFASATTDMKYRSIDE